MFQQSREALRHTYYTAWKKAQDHLPLTPLEQQIVTIIAQHPEYHPIFQQPDRYLYQDYLPEFGETNPFLHMGLHLALQEQCNTNRPAGIQKIHQTLCQQLGETHAAEHKMMAVLAESLHEAQRNNQPPDEQRYVQALQEMLRLPSS